jgi:hypothetical protein
MIFQNRRSLNFVNTLIYVINLLKDLDYEKRS